MVRSTHGVNCTGSCSWKVYVKDGIITWETQQTDYPSVGPDSPEYEPRGCPRGASFSWYTYSPSRVRYPYVRGPLLEMWREARARLGDPVAAWAEITGDPERTARYKGARGKGGFVRSTWPEVSELIAAAHVHTIKEYGPDRVVGFSPIPAMSQVSYSAGTRFLSMIGGTILSFYDWYADMPIASPQVFGDQTDVPESGDWWNSSYLMIWGTNLPITRTPDAHFMTEARYRGQKVVVVSPDYSDHTKFADDWLAVRARHRRRAGDGDGARDPDRVLPRPAGAVLHRLRQDLHRPAVPGDPARARRRLRAGPVPDRRRSRRTTARAPRTRPCCWTRRPASRSYPNGSLGFALRRGRARASGTSTSAGSIRVLTLYGMHEEAVPVDLPRFDVGETEGGGGDPPRRPGHPGRRPAGHHGVRPADGAVRGRPRRPARASGRPATTTRSPTRRRGRRRSPRCPRRPRRGWRASSPATPSCPGAGR